MYFPNENSNGSSSDNKGYIWVIIIVICIVVGIIIAVYVNDDSYSVSTTEEHVYEPAYEELVETTEVTASSRASFLSVSKSNVTFDADGGYVDIDISTDGDWDIGTKPYDWGHITKYSSSIRLRVNSYSGDEDRTDYFTITSGDYERRINIEQYARRRQTTYLSVSKSNVTFDADGGYVDIDVNTDGDWDIGTEPYDWGHITKYSSSIRLRVDSYSGDEDRTDYFTITSGDYERRINIKQYANTEPSADIESIWTDHNEYYNGYKGMIIHVRFTTENLLDETVYVYAYLYYGNNTTPLHDPYGNDLFYYGTGKVNYTSCRFDDFRIFVPYAGLYMAPGWSGSLSFDIVVKHDGKKLARKDNTQFTFTNGY